MISYKKYKNNKIDIFILKINIIEVKYKNYLNFKRVLKEKKLKSFNEKFNIFKSFIPVLDSLDLSIFKCKNRSLKEGLVITIRMINSIFNMNNIKVIKAFKNNIYNPFYHEAIIRVRSNNKENLIYNVLQKGYIYFNKILRPSIVCITCK
ncbi:nucleotide exchange factor GrpE [Candidatus Vidania fulgoroideorum]